MASFTADLVIRRNIEILVGEKSDSEHSVHSSVLIEIL